MNLAMPDVALTAAPMPATVPIAATMCGIALGGVLVVTWALRTARKEGRNR